MGAIHGSACVRKSSNAVKSLFDFGLSTVFVREVDVGREGQKKFIQNRRHGPPHRWLGNADMSQTIFWILLLLLKETCNKCG